MFSRVGDVKVLMLNEVKKRLFENGIVIIARVSNTTFIIGFVRPDK